MSAFSAGLVFKSLDMALTSDLHDRIDLPSLLAWWVGFEPRESAKIKRGSSLYLTALRFVHYCHAVTTERGANEETPKLPAPFF